MKSAIHFGQFDTPEALFAINPSAQPGLHIDALNATLARADAVESCPPQSVDDGKTYVAVTSEWIAEQLAIGEQSERRHGLWFEDAE